MEVQHETWITRAECARRIGVHPDTALKILVAGGVRRFAPEGVDPRWHAGDVQAIIDSSVKTGSFTPRARKPGRRVTCG